MRHIPMMSVADALSWTILVGMLGGCVVLGLAMGFGIEPMRAIPPATGLCLLAWGVAIGRRRGQERVTAGAIALLQMTLFTILGVTLAYLLAARADPLWDSELAAADSRLGIAWPAVLDVADSMPAALLLLGGVAYHSLSLQMVGCILALTLTGRLDRLRLAVAAAILAGVITTLISGLMPAVGNLFDPHDYDRLWPSIAWLERDLNAGLRTGTLRQLDLSQLMGIVSFPSYHATLPVILAWSLRPIRGIFGPSAVWAGLTIAATPLFGGHYVVDVLAGLALAVAAIATSRLLAAEERRLSAGCLMTRSVLCPGCARSAETRARAQDDAGVMHGLV